MQLVIITETPQSGKSSKNFGTASPLTVAEHLSFHKCYINISLKKIRHLNNKKYCFNLFMWHAYCMSPCERAVTVL